MRVVVVAVRDFGHKRIKGSIDLFLIAPIDLIAYIKPFLEPTRTIGIFVSDLNSHKHRFLINKALFLTHSYSKLQ